ncbi:MAG: nitrophenyl compound nitroreductase subunit ArsF family protein [Desulfobacteraceae bacterium]|jgi:hypothetical protein|nr:nitrophenyl compound nitroreductase subunit ArsF family protein [Desulfobacteraceae bacterium]
MKKYIYSLVFTGLIVFITVLPGISAEEAVKPATEVKPAAHQIVVTYFHTTARCPTCHTIEELSSKAVQLNFEEALKSGKVVWRVINVDEPENKHYNDDYQLYTKSLIISEVKDGKEVRWKNLEKIWVLVRDDEKFDAYVKDEIADWLKE